ncbi:hypothetical protein NDU88_000337, partial [Pleurodeles waltl]
MRPPPSPEAAGLFAEPGGGGCGFGLPAAAGQMLRARDLTQRRAVSAFHPSCWGGSSSGAISLSHSLVAFYVAEYGNVLVAEFLNLMVVLAWVLKDGMATHRVGHTLDGIFTRPEEAFYLSTTPLEWTDHALLTFKFLAKQQPIISIPQKKLIRPWRKIAVEPLKATLLHNWNDPKVSMLSPLARFNLGIQQAMDTLAPARISASRIRKKPNQPWFSQALKILQRKYRQKERCWKLSLCEAERVDLKLALNTYKEACRVAKSDYF